MEKIGIEPATILSGRSTAPTDTGLPYPTKSPKANLVDGSSLGDDNVAGVLDDGHAIGVEQLAVAFAALAELELEASLLVENLIGKDWISRLRRLVDTSLD